MGAPLAVVLALAAAAVSVRTNKGIVIPGTDASAELLVVAPDAPPGAKVEITTTAGKVQDFRALGDGRYQATWVPLEGEPPAMAFITARVGSSEATELGLTAIAVHGEVTVEADVAPNAKVTIDAGGRTFGPFTADGSGHVRAQVLVPPRLREVTLRTEAGERAVPLQLPPVSLLYMAAVAPPGEPPSHGHGEAPLEVMVLSVDRSGYPAWKPVPRVVASKGEAAAQGPVAPGVFRWTYEAPESPPSGEAKLTATLDGDPASVAILEVALRPPRPEAVAKRASPPAAPRAAWGPITLRLSGKKVSADGPSEVMVEIARGDRVLTPAEVAAATIDADLGTLIPAAGGVRWVFPHAFGGLTEAAIRVNAGGAKAEEKVTLVSGPPAVGRIAFESPPARGGRAIGARLTLIDSHDNPVKDARFLVRANKGEAGTMAFEEPGGIYRFSYTPPEVTSPETVKVEVETSTGLVVAAPPLQVVPRLTGIGLSAGVTLAVHNNGALAQGTTLGAELGVRVPSLPVEGFLRVDRSFYPDALVDLPLTDRTITFGSFGAGLGLRAEAPIRPPFGLYVAAGVLGRRVDDLIVVRISTTTVVSETSAALYAGAEGAVGATYRAGAARFSLEGFYSRVQGQGALRGNLVGWGVRGSILLEVL